MNGAAEKQKTLGELEEAKNAILEVLANENQAFDSKQIENLITLPKFSNVVDFLSLEQRRLLLKLMLRKLKEPCFEISVTEEQLRQSYVRMDMPDFPALLHVMLDSERAIPEKRSETYFKYWRLIEQFTNVCSFIKLERVKLPDEEIDAEISNFDIRTPSDKAQAFKIMYFIIRNKFQAEKVGEDWIVRLRDKVEGKVIRVSGYSVEMARKIGKPLSFIVAMLEVSNRKLGYSFEELPDVYFTQDEMAALIDLTFNYIFSDTTEQ